MNHERFTFTLTALIALAVSPVLVNAQTSADELAKQASNPIANLISLPFQNNTSFGIGPYDRTSNVLNIQPVVPLMEGRLITRTIFPIVWIPNVGADTGMVSTGLSDVNFTAFFSPPSEALTWGVGPIVTIPTGGDMRGTGNWGIGPSAVALLQQGPWTLGALANTIWSIGSDTEHPATANGLLQYFIVRQFEGGWYVNSAPIITVDWKAEEDAWLVPFGLGFGKVIFLGKLPVNLQLGAYYNVVAPEGAADWQSRVQIQMMFPLSMFGG